MVSRYICKNLLKYENHRKNLTNVHRAKVSQTPFPIQIVLHTQHLSSLLLLGSPVFNLLLQLFKKTISERERCTWQQSLHCYHKHMLENQMNTHYTSIFRNQINTHGRGEVGGVDLTGLPLLPPYYPARPLFTSGNYIYWSTGQDIHSKTLKLPGLPFLLVIEIGVSLGILFSKDYISERLKFRKHPSPS